MSDFFISEMSVTALLIFPILRAFSKPLKSCKAIPLLPFAAFAICIFIVLGQGPSISFLPVLLIVLICIITESLRFVKLCIGLPNHFYGTFAVIVRFLLLIIFFKIIVFISVMEFKFPHTDRFALKKAGISRNLLFENEKTPSPYGFLYKKALFLPSSASEKDKFTAGTGTQHFNNGAGNLENENAEKPLIIIMNRFKHTSPEPESITMHLVQKGFEVIELHSLEKRRRVLPRLDEFLCIIKAISGQTFPIPEKIEAGSLSFAALGKVVTAYAKNRPVFAFSEGSAAEVITGFALKDKNLSGVFILLSEKEAYTAGIKPGKNLLLETKSGLGFEQNSSGIPFFFLIRRPREMFPRFTDICFANTAALLSKNRTGDAEEKERANLFENWINTKLESLSPESYSDTGTEEKNDI